MSLWNESTTSTLKSLASVNELSCTGMAAELSSLTGQHFTRSAIAGKLFRLSTSVGKSLQAMSACSRQTRLANRLERGGDSPRDEHVVDGIEFGVSFGMRRTLETLTRETCRYPFGDPGVDGFHFCGFAAVDGRPYCPYHKRLTSVARQRRAAA